MERGSIIIYRIWILPLKQRRMVYPNVNQYTRLRGVGFPTPQILEEE